MDDAVVEPQAHPLAPVADAVRDACPDDPGLRQYFVDDAGRRMGRVRQLYGLGAEELGLVYQHVVFRLCATEATVNSLLQLAEIAEAPVHGHRASVDPRRAMYLAEAARTQQWAAEQITAVADRFAEQEVDFGEFARAIVRGNIALDGASALLITAVALPYIVSAALVAVLLVTLLMALYFGSTYYRMRVARRQIRAVGQQARDQIDALSERYIAEVLHDFN